MSITDHFIKRQDKIFNEAKDYLLILIGTFIYSIGFAAFILPYGLTTGGVAGISSIIYYAKGLEVQVTYFIINLTFLIVAVKVLGLRFCLKTIWGVLSITFWLWLMQHILKEPDPINPGKMILPQFVGDQSFMAAVIGALFSGTGLAICFENNGSTGGTDIIAAIVNKYRPVSLGSVIMACDVIIISSCYFIFHDPARVIFGFVILFICSYTLDYWMRRHSQSVQFMIFSRNYRMIADAIIESGHGVTVLDGEGWYTKSERRTVVCIVRKRQSKEILRIIKLIDPYAMVSMSEAQGVYGHQFDTLQQIAKSKNKRRTLVLCSNNGTKIETCRVALGSRFEIRSLLDVGCDTRQDFNAAILSQDPKNRVAFLKKYFGFDALYLGKDGKVTLAEGDYDKENVKFSYFDTIEELKSYLKSEK